MELYMTLHVIFHTDLAHDFNDAYRIDHTERYNYTFNYDYITITLQLRYSYIAYYNYYYTLT